MVAIARVLPVAVALLASLGSRTPLLSQESDVDAVKRVVRSESDAFFRRDSDGWKHSWVQDSGAVAVKRDGEWKIISSGVYLTNTFDASPAAIEGRLRGVASTLSGAKKTGEAIEVLKLNVQLFPNSARVYQDLGDAYATSGDTRFAIRNYEKALLIDPKNEAYRLELAKLRVELACAHGSRDGLKCQL